MPQLMKFTQGLTLKRHIEATLGSGNIREAVQLPPGEDLNEWLAVNTVDFYNAISVLFGTLEEFCTVKTCPVMSAGPTATSFCSVCTTLKFCIALATKHALSYTFVTFCVSSLGLADGLSCACMH